MFCLLMEVDECEGLIPDVKQTNKQEAGGLELYAFRTQSFKKFGSLARSVARSLVRSTAR